MYALSIQNCRSTSQRNKSIDMMYFPQWLEQEWLHLSFTIVRKELDFHWERTANLGRCELLFHGMLLLSTTIIRCYGSNQSWMDLFNHTSKNYFSADRTSFRHDLRWGEPMKLDVSGVENLLYPFGQLIPFSAECEDSFEALTWIWFSQSHIEMYNLLLSDSLETT